MAALIDSMGKRLEQVTEELNGVRKRLEKMEQEKTERNAGTQNVRVFLLLQFTLIT